MYELTPNGSPKRKRGSVLLNITVGLLAASLILIAGTLVATMPAPKTASSIAKPLAATTVATSIASTPTPTPTPDCRDEILAYKKETLFPILDEWQDAYDLASSSSRIALGPPVAMLQEINRRLKRIEPSKCALTKHLFFIQATDIVIDGFLAFMANKPDSEVQAHFETAAILLDILIDETPTPTPTPTASGKTPVGGSN